MLRRHSWFMPARTSSSVRPASGTWKTYCGWPSAKPPPMTARRLGAPAERGSWATTRAPTGSRSVGGRSARRADVGVGETLLDLRRAPAPGDHGRSHPDAERALRLEVRGHRAQPVVEPVRGPVEDRALGQVGEVALDPRQLAVQHQPGADQLGAAGAAEPAQRLVPPLRLHPTPRRGLQEARRALGAQEGEVLLRADRPDGEGHPSRLSASPNRSGGCSPSRARTCNAVRANVYQAAGAAALVRRDRSD